MHTQKKVTSRLKKVIPRSTSLATPPSGADLFAHAVNAVGPQQVHGLLDQVRPAAVEHPEAQVLQELGLRGGCVQLSGGTEAVLRSADGKSRSTTVTKWQRLSDVMSISTAISDIYRHKLLVL